MRIVSLAAQESQRFIAVANQMDVHGWVEDAQRLLHQAHVGWVVLDNQYLPAIEHWLSKSKQLRL
jgi:hypothetical protein